jgi:hypothetical protein
MVKMRKKGNVGSKRYCRKNEPMMSNQSRGRETGI